MISERVRLFWVLGSFVAILVLGTLAYLHTPLPPLEPDGPGFFSALYHSLQLFALEYPSDSIKEPGIWLQIARFGAAAFSTFTVLALLLPRAVRWAQLTFQRLFRLRAVVLGYGPAGQALARELRSRPDHRFMVTAVRRGVTPEHMSVARRDGVLLIEGDPSDPKTYRRIRLTEARKIFAALDDDMHTLDAAEAARGAVGNGKAEVVALLADPDIAAGLADSSPRGFLGGPGIRGYSLADEAAQALIADARFDRVALEAGQRRVHLVIMGCGAQGEAVAIETLLTAWRVGLKPPKITILDRNIGPVKARFKRRSPAFFIEENESGHLPEAARPQIVFHSLRIEKTDFANDQAIESLCGDDEKVTAWVFAAGDDSLNLRAALALHTAMLRRQRAAAPIHVRIWNRHDGDTPVMSRPHVSIAQTFGSFENAIATTTACNLNPDEAAQALHSQYVETGKKMRVENPAFEFMGDPWDELGETMKAANRRLRRHAVMKLEDLNAQWRPKGRALPVVEAHLREGHLRLEERFDYARVTSEPLPPEWWLGTRPLNLEAGDTERANRIKNVAIAEHNRWTVDRAIDGWRPTSDLNPKRDNERRIHPAMHGWDTLEPMTKRWDAVLLRTLIEGGTESEVTAWRRKQGSLILAFDKPSGSAPRWIGKDALLREQGVTQIDLAIVCAVEPKPAAELARQARRTMDELLGTPGAFDKLCRLRFTFTSPPGENALLVANEIADAAAERGIEISSSWLWSKTDRAIGFVGHRELSRLAPDAEKNLPAYLERLFISLVANGRAIRLVSGYAPGADQIAVDCWNRLGLTRPDLVFPFADADGRVFFTNSIPKADAATERFTREVAEKIGTPRVATVRPGGDAHASQALDIIENCDVLVAVFDGNGASGSGSVGDTIARARARGAHVIEVLFGEDGFHNEES